MIKGFLGITMAMGFALASSVAFAGTYVSGPLPSEFGGGFVSPVPNVFKNIQKASKEGAKLAASVEKCYSKGALNFSKNKATNVDDCLNGPTKGVIPKFVAKINKIAPRRRVFPPATTTWRTVRRSPPW